MELDDILFDATSQKVFFKMTDIRDLTRHSLGYTLLSQKIYHQTALNFAEYLSPEELVEEVNQALTAEQKIP